MIGRVNVKRRLGRYNAASIALVAALVLPVWSAPSKLRENALADDEKIVRKAPREGEVPTRVGPRDGEGPPREGPRDGEGQRKSGAREAERRPEQVKRESSERAPSPPVLVPPRLQRYIANPLQIGPLPPIPAGEIPTKGIATLALRKAVWFFYSEVSRNGGYLWEYSGDLKMREAEGKVNDSRIWVQPPGTPTIGEAFLDAYEATGEQLYLDAALDAAYALLKGQLRSGGWDYFVTFDPADPQPSRTNFDDDTTQAALRFLMRLDKILQFKDKAIHDAAMVTLSSVVQSQYPNGGWFVLLRRPPQPMSDKEYPVVKASYPESWPRSPKDYVERPRVCYIINDDLVSDIIRTLLNAWETYGDAQYLASAKKGGDFLLLAQMPDPQPAWCQTYDVNMQPVWGRVFEPPAITGAESQTVLETLLMLYRRTGDKKYLEPVPRAIAYFRKSLLPDGRIARFYELKTNRPLFFTKKYVLTYSADDMPTHYAFIWQSRLDAIEAEYKRLLTADPSKLSETEKPSARDLAEKARTTINSMDERGAWVEKGMLRFHEIAPPSGVIKCQTFADNVKTLSQYLSQSR